MKNQVLAAVLLVSFAAALAAQVPADERSKLARLLPDPQSTGATAQQARFYGADLYQYIDGAAEVYHSYEMVAMVHREYKAGAADVTVDIYDMHDPLNAFGIYSAERSPENRYIPVGAEGYIDQNVLNFLQGTFYVKLSAFSDKGSVQPLMRSFAFEISKRIGGSRSMPAVLALLPVAGRVPHSEKYVKKAPLGHEFLAPACTADYRFSGKLSTVVVSLSADSREANRRFQSLKAYFAKAGKVVDEPAVTGGLRGFDSEGNMLFFLLSRYTVLVANPPADSAALLKDLIAHTKE